MKVYMIRHGMTAGNLEHRYVGSTDEPLLSESRELLDKCALQADSRYQMGKYSQGKRVYVSPMLRCRETAALLYPEAEQICVDAFRECDFGKFEYKNYEELNGNPDYQRFIDSEGCQGFPGGESRDAFIERCAAGFETVCKLHLQSALESESCGWKASSDILMVVHGGTIMALLSRYARPKRGYYDWQVKNGQGYSMELMHDENGIWFSDIDFLDIHI